MDLCDDVQKKHEFTQLCTCDNLSSPLVICLCAKMNGHC